MNVNASQTKGIVSATSPLNVVQRMQEAGFPLYWYNPLVDDPKRPGSLTKRLRSLNVLPCLNTGGTVGTLALIFSIMILKMTKVAVVGMDFGYYQDTPFNKTQTYYELQDYCKKNNLSLSGCFAEHRNVLTDEIFLTDPTYAWYKKNFIECLHMVRHACPNIELYNCTEGGTLDSPLIPSSYLDDFLRAR